LRIGNAGERMSGGHVVTGQSGVDEMVLPRSRNSLRERVQCVQVGAYFKVVIPSLVNDTSTLPKVTTVKYDDGMRFAAVSEFPQGQGLATDNGAGQYTRICAVKQHLNDEYAFLFRVLNDE
jgi:hypothetical protein